MFGTIVLSIAGRDKGYYFIVTTVQDNFVYIVDGDIHKIENPKYKKIKHIEVVGKCEESLIKRLINNNKVTNQDIKRALKKLQEA